MKAYWERYSWTKRTLQREGLLLSVGAGQRVVLAWLRGVGDRRGGRGRGGLHCRRLVHEQKSACGPDVL
jgi:hypothetical protein